MFIETLSFLNVRKTTEAHYNFIPQTNLIVGKNGAGKTTIIEALFLLSTTKSFRKKQNKAIIKEGKNTLQAKGVFFEKENQKTIKISIKNNKKIITENQKTIKRTSQLLNKTPMVCMSPEETDVIESYKGEKMKYFDKIIFRINQKHIKEIKEYKTLLHYRNTLLEQKKETSPWDKKIAETGINIWATREKFFKEIITTFNKVQKKTKTTKYSIEYFAPQIINQKKYIKKLQEKTNQEKTNTGPHQDTTIFKINNKNLQENGSQGEKKLFKCLLKLAEVEILKTNQEKTPIFLLDDFFAKLDDENIMKIFIYFHCKFQTIITTTETKKNTIKNILGVKNEEKIKIIKCQ